MVDKNQDQQHTSSSRRQRAKGAWHRVKPWVVAGLFTFWTAMVLYEVTGHGVNWTGGDYGLALVLSLGGYFFIDLIGELFDSGR